MCDGIQQIPRQIPACVIDTSVLMEATESTDEALMLAYATGETAALRTLFDRYAPRIHAMARRHLPSDGQAREVVLGTFVELHRARREFGAGSVVHLWLLQIAMNLLRDRWRAVNGSVVTLASRTSEPSADTGGSAELERALDFQVLEERIAADARSPLARLRDRSTALRTSFASALFAAIALVAIRGARLAESPAVGSVRVIAAVLVFGMLFELTVALALRPPFVPGQRRTALAGTIVLTLVVSAAFAAWPIPTTGAAVLGPVRPHGWSAGLPCLSQGLLVAIPTYLAIRLADRGGRISRWLAVAASAVGANLVLTIVCPVADPAHRLSTHAGIGVLLLACLGLSTLVERLVRGSTDR